MHSGLGKDGAGEGMHIGEKMFLGEKVAL